MRNSMLVAACLGLLGCGPTFDAVPPNVAGKATAGKSAPRTDGEALVGEGFVQLGQRKGVVLYRRDKLPGFELGAEGDLPASPERILKVLLDYPNHKRWQTHLVECKVLAQGPDSVDVYERLGLPVIEDRDYTLHVTSGKDGNVLWTRFMTANDRGPHEVADVVRVTEHEGGWRLTPIDGGKATHAFYRFHLDLASDMTEMMGKGQAEEDLVELFSQIQSQLPSYPE